MASTKKHGDVGFLEMDGFDRDEFSVILQLEIGENSPVAAVVVVVQDTQCDTVASHFKLQLIEVHALREAVGSGFHVVGVVLGVVVSPPAPATTIGRPASTVVVVGELFGIGAF